MLHQLISHNDVATHDKNEHLLSICNSDSHIFCLLQIPGALLF